MDWDWFLNLLHLRMDIVLLHYWSVLRELMFFSHQVPGSVRERRWKEKESGIRQTWGLMEKKKKLSSEWSEGSIVTCNEAMSGGCTDFLSLQIITNTAFAAARFWFYHGCCKEAGSGGQAGQVASADCAEVCVRVVLLVVIAPAILSLCEVYMIDWPPPQKYLLWKCWSWMVWRAAKASKAWGDTNNSSCSLVLCRWCLINNHRYGPSFSTSGIAGEKLNFYIIRPRLP